MRFQLAVVLLLAALLALWDPLVSCRAAPLPPNTAPVNCSESVSCKSCASQPGCGWCAYMLTCLEGNSNGSTSGLCTDVWTVWMFEPKLCPATSPFPSLCTSKPCSDCVKANGCGWCDSTCVPGTDSDPYYGTCVSWHSSVCPVVLARNVWWLWAMFAVLMLSMLSTVRPSPFSA